MKGTDRLILVGLPLLALLVGFWFLAVAPKRQDAADLQQRIDSLNLSIQASESQIASAEAARDAFPTNYGELVTLGRAVPEDADQSTLLYDLAELGKDNEVQFRSFEITGGGGEAPAPAPAPTPPPDPNAPPPDPNAPPPDPGATPGTEATPASAPAAPAIATEATAAALPIGASVGPAGLPTVPYEFKFLGNFFDMADFFADLDSKVKVEAGQPNVKGRLLTVNGFSLTGDQLSGFPNVEANFAVTSYVVPPEQGLQAGANPAGPAPVQPGGSATVATPAAAVVTP